MRQPVHNLLVSITMNSLGVEGSEHVLGRALGHFIFSLIGLKTILFTNIFQRL